MNLVILPHCAKDETLKNDDWVHTQSLHSLMRQYHEGQKLWENCMINVAAKPTVLSSKFYSNNCQGVCPAECTVVELEEKIMVYVRHSSKEPKSSAKSVSRELVKMIFFLMLFHTIFMSTLAIAVTSLCPSALSCFFWTCEMYKKAETCGAVWQRYKTSPCPFLRTHLQQLTVHVCSGFTPAATALVKLTVENSQCNCIALKELQHDTPVGTAAGVLTGFSLLASEKSIAFLITLPPPRGQGDAWWWSMYVCSDISDIRWRALTYDDKACGWWRRVIQPLFSINTFLFLLPCSESVSHLTSLSVRLSLSLFLSAVSILSI